MRTTRILRAVAQQARFLEAGAPTGLTGLLTHETPRASLIYVYHNTLQKLKHLPESSVYRQSTEALTKHRLSIIEGVRPQGLEEWRSRVKSTIEAHPEAFQAVAAQANPEDVNYIAHEFRTRPEIEDSKSSEPARERTPEERAEFIHNVMEHNRQIEEELSAMEPEPPLSAEQINEVEAKMEAGLIEEVIQVAEGESKLVDTMIKNEVWQELEEKPVEGQWVYHGRDTHTPKTQAP